MVFRYLRFSAAILIIGITLTADSKLFLPGQEKQRPRQIDGQTYKVNVDLVNILCSVLDKKTNSFVTNLTREDFVIYEDDQIQQIKNFARESNLPLTLALLIDTSDSVAPKLKFEQDAAIGFFQSIMQENDRAMLLEFNSGVNLLQDFTNDPNKLTKQIRKLRTGGNTALYDALEITCDEKLIRELGRKAIIVISDGDDESSKSTLQQAKEMALRAEATVFAISTSKFGLEDDRKQGDSVLKEIAQATGGRIFFPFKAEDLNENFRQINQELRSQYSIIYTSTNPARDGNYRRIVIKMKEKGLNLSHRKGYYAPRG
jgi:Ca-activated chloride channel homolog